MPIKPENKARYPKDWKQIRERILHRADYRCEAQGCGLANYAINPRTGSKVVLTIAHLDHTPENCDDANLMAMCQHHHLAYDLKHHQQNAYQTRRNGKAIDCFESAKAGDANEA
jgi:5-methylcytosine-specific restriction endonuclease McrA